MVICYARSHYGEVAIVVKAPLVGNLALYRQVFVVTFHKSSQQKKFCRIFEVFCSLLEKDSERL